MANGYKPSEVGQPGQLHDTDRLPIDQGDGRAVAATVGQLQQYMAENMGEELANAAKEEAGAVIAAALVAIEEKVDAIKN